MLLASVYLYSSKASSSIITPKRVIIPMDTTNFIISLTKKVKDGDNLSPSGQVVINCSHLKSELFLKALFEVIAESLIVNRRFHFRKLGAFSLILSNAPFSVKKEIVFKPSSSLLRYLDDAAYNNASSSASD